MVSVTNSDGTTVVTCQSLHLTSFAVLVDVAGGTTDVCTVYIHSYIYNSYILGFYISICRYLILN